ncbi:MAG: 50S ribosomal protein L15 [bacterium]
MDNRIELTDLRPADGATHRVKRKGRGRSSGHGKTCCRGHNGEGQRSGQSAKRGFEGGQMPAYRRLPKLKGMTIVNPIIFAEINVSDLNKFDDAEINLTVLKQKGLFTKKYEALRVLGNGEVTKAVSVKAAYFTASAKAKIEAAGGKAEVV